MFDRFFEGYINSIMPIIHFKYENDNYGIYFIVKNLVFLSKIFYFNKNYNDFEILLKNS